MLNSREWPEVSEAVTAISQNNVRPQNRNSSGPSATSLENYFYFFMSLMIAAVVICGFSQTIGKKLIHPALSRPFVLYVHAVVFFGWVLFFILQSGLVRIRMTSWHKRIGWFGVVLAATMLVVGVTTAIEMARFNRLYLPKSHPAANLLVSFFDITAFSIPFALAICLRRKPEFHRRLQLMACCALTAAAFGRFPPPFVAFGTLYVGVDILILLAIGRDLIINRRIHQVYLYGLPAFIAGQVFVLYTITHRPEWYVESARVLLG